MDRIGILAYGSLIDDPGKELEPLIRRRVKVKTPFLVEFARSSSSRGGAPTLIPVKNGGAQVQGVILVLDPTVEISLAEDLLWRRETRKEFSDEHYHRIVDPGKNSVIVNYLRNFENVETVLFAEIGENIKSRTAENLADLAIKSAQGEAGAKKMDGINYLISIKKHGIQTPLLPHYEASILEKATARTLGEAYDKIRSGDA